MERKIETTKKEKKSTALKSKTWHKKKHHLSNADNKVKTTTEGIAKKRNNTIFEEKEKTHKKQCSSDVNVLINAVTEDEIEARELDNRITFINGQYVKSIASKKTIKTSKKRTPMEMALELASSILPLNNSSNTYAWSEALYDKLNKASSLKYLILHFINDKNIKKWSLENEFVMQRFFSNQDVNAEYRRIVNLPSNNAETLESTQPQVASSQTTETPRPFDLGSDNGNVRPNNTICCFWHKATQLKTNKLNFMFSALPKTEPKNNIEKASPFSPFVNIKGPEITMELMDNNEIFIADSRNENTFYFFQNTPVQQPEKNMELINSDEDSNTDVYNYDFI